MKQILIFWFILTTLLFSLTIAVLSDSRGNELGVNSKILKKIIAQIVEEKVDVVIFGGDFVSGSKNLKELNKMFKNFKKIIAALKNVFFVCGNHDVRDKNQFYLYNKYFPAPAGSIKLEKYKDTVYFKTVNDINIVILNSEYPGERHKISKKQLEFLSKVLNQNKITIIAAHEPAYPVGPHKGSSLDKYPALRDKFWELLQGKKVIYFCGHEHLYNRKKINGVWQIIAGTCGAPIYRNYGGEFYHWVYLKIKNNTISGIVFDENGIRKDVFKIRFKEVKK